MKKEKAFTLLEMIIVLGICALTLLLAWPNAKKTLQTNQERQFWQSMRQDWQAAQIQAKANHVGTVIVYQPNSGKIVFASKIKTNAVKVPATLQVQHFNPVTMKANGYVSPQTQVFVSKIDGATYQMKIQLAWGGYRVQKN